MNQEHDTQPLPLSDTRAPVDEQTPQHSVAPTKPKRRLAWVAVIGAILIAVSVSTALLLPRPESTPVEAAPTNATQSKPATTSPEAPITPSPSSAPTETDDSAPPVPAPSNPSVQHQNAVAFTAFQPSGAAVLCADESQVHPITFSWQSQNAVSAWFGIDTPNAQTAPLQEVAPSGSITWDFFCSNQATTYTVTLADANGKLAHRSIVVERQ